MTKRELFVQSSCIVTINKLEGLELVCAKIESPFSSSDFLFYIIELGKTYQNSKTVRKISQLLQNNAKLTNAFDDAFFEKTIGEINKTLRRLAENEDNSWIGNLNAVIGLVGNGNIYLTQAGIMTGYIFRKNKVSAILDRNEDTDHEVTFSEITSGKIINNDQILFGNFRLLNRISLDRIRNFLSDRPAKETMTELSRYLQRNKVKDVNAILIQATENDSSTNSDPDSDIIFLDEEKNEFKDFLQKKALPAGGRFLSTANQTSRQLLKQGKSVYRLLKKRWDEKYGPRTKKAFTSGKKSFEDLIVKSGDKVKPQLSKIKNEYNGKIKIKAVAYHKKYAGNDLAVKIQDAFSVAAIAFKRENRKYLYVALILVALIIGYNKIKENNEKRTEIVKQIEVINSYDKAVEAFDRAKEDLLLGKTTSLAALQVALDLANKAKQVESNQDRALKLEKEIKDFLDERTKTVRFYNPDAFDFQDTISNILIAGSEIYGIDQTGKIFIADTRERKTNIIDSLPADAGKFVNFSYSDSLEKLFIQTNKKQIFTFSIKDRTLEELKMADDAVWEDAISISTYSTNIYLLDSENGQVWKHTLKNDAYQKGSTYADTKKNSLRGAVDLVVDGNLFVLKNDGKVSKYVKGTLEPDFALKNIPKPDDQILIPAKIYTEEGSNSIFVLDKKANRIIKFDKAGDFVNQYVFDGLTVDSFVANAKLQKIWALSGGKIYEGNL